MAPFLSNQAAAGLSPQDRVLDVLNDPQAVTLRPLNRTEDNLFAGHRSHSSHSSHASHSSHYSGASGGTSYSSPQASPTPDYSPPTPAPALLPSTTGYAPTNTLVAPAKSSVTPRISTTDGVVLTTGEQLKLQIIRVQIKLHMLQLYEGPIDGVRNPQTAGALKNFQTLKGLQSNGLMTTATLNALGIMAVN